MMKQKFIAALFASTAISSGLLSGFAFAGPQGEAVVSGDVVVSRPNDATTIIQQGNDKAIINWDSFNVGAQEFVDFQQVNESAIALNRVVGGNPSSILGRIQANGNVWIINPDGILFGSQAQIDVGGLVATTHDISNQNFLDGNYQFNQPGNPSASIVNNGSITIGDSGVAALVAPGVRNSGIISARLGKVETASANRFTLDLFGDNLIKLEVGDEIVSQVVDAETGETMSSLNENTGTLAADGGRVAMRAVTARQAVDSVINTSGVLRAKYVQVAQNKIVLGSSPLPNISDSFSDGVSDGSSGIPPLPRQRVRVSGDIIADNQSATDNSARVSIEGDEIILSGATLNGSSIGAGSQIGIGIFNYFDYLDGNNSDEFPLDVSRAVSIDTDSIIDASYGNALLAPFTGSDSYIDIAYSDNLTVSGILSVQSFSEFINTGRITLRNDTRRGGDFNFADIDQGDYNIGAFNGVSGGTFRLIEPDTTITGSRADLVSNLLNQGNVEIYSDFISWQDSLLKSSSVNSRLSLYGDDGIGIDSNVGLSSNDGLVDIFLTPNADLFGSYFTSFFGDGELDQVTNETLDYINSPYFSGSVSSSIEAWLNWAANNPDTITFTDAQGNNDVLDLPNISQNDLNEYQASVVTFGGNNNFDLAGGQITTLKEQFVILSDAPLDDTPPNFYASTKYTNQDGTITYLTDLDATQITGSFDPVAPSQDPTDPTTGGGGSDPTTGNGNQDGGGSDPATGGGGQNGNQNNGNSTDPDGNPIGVPNDGSSGNGQNDDEEESNFSSENDSDVNPVRGTRFTPSEPELPNTQEIVDVSVNPVGGNVGGVNIDTPLITNSTNATQPAPNANGDNNGNTPFITGALNDNGSLPRENIANGGASQNNDGSFITGSINPLADPIGQPNLFGPDGRRLQRFRPLNGAENESFGRFRMARAPRITNSNEQYLTGIPPIEETRFLPDQVLVIFSNEPDEVVLQQITQEYGISVLSSTPLTLLGGVVYQMQITGDQTPRDILEAMQNDERFVFAQPNFTFGHPDVQYKLQSAGSEAANFSPDPELQYAIGKLRLTDAHQFTRGEQIRVAVIDSGIDELHPDLNGAVIGRFNALSTPENPHSHGTAMAGAIAARGQIVGVAPQVDILAARAFDVDENGAQGTSYDLLKAINWSFESGARIINMSFAGPEDPTLTSAVQSASENGVVLIAAAGNAGPSSPPLYPAAYDEVVAVTATDTNDGVFDQANRGDYVELAAPGVDILVASPNQSYEIASGTSVAAAHVSGLAALLLARYPELTAEQIRLVLNNSALDLGASGPDPEYGAGLADIVQALEAATAKIALEE